MSAIQQMLIGGNAGVTLKSALTTAGLTTNLKLCLDSGDASSYNPSVQTDKWLDVAGSGYDFYRGSGTGSDAADPTFNGSGGALNSYWSFDGGDCFTYDAANETWMESLHKNSAIFSVVAFFYHAVEVSDSLIFLDQFSGGTGISYQLTSSGTQRFRAVNAGATALTKTVDSAAAVGWHMIGLSLNEATGAGGGFFYKDGGYDQVSSADTFDSTYTSPSAGSATYTMGIGGLNGLDVSPNNERLACIAVWQGTAITKANMDTIFTAMRGRFGI